MNCKFFGHTPEVGEEHVDWLETQLDLIGRIGIQNYRPSMM